MTEAERTIYETVEDHIASTCSRASGKERTAVGFVMTTFRDRYGAVGFGACAGAELSRIGTFVADTISGAANAMQLPPCNPSSRTSEPREENGNGETQTLRDLRVSLLTAAFGGSTNGHPASRCRRWRARVRLGLNADAFGLLTPPTPPLVPNVP